MKVAFLLSRQEKRPGPESWWVRASYAAAGWSVLQGWTLVSGKGLLPVDFTRWAYAHQGGRVEIIDTPLDRKSGETPCGTGTGA